VKLITTKICKVSDLGIHGNLFGGKMLAWIDESAGAISAEICDTPKMVTLKLSEVVFKMPVKVGNIIKIYYEIQNIGRTSITLNIEARKHNVLTGQQKTVCSTQIVFVRIDDDGEPVPISERVKKRYGF
jgi:acyl-CoA thioesterase YciA